VPKGIFNLLGYKGFTSICDQSRHCSLFPDDIIQGMDEKSVRRFAICITESGLISLHIYIIHSPYFKDKMGEQTPAR